MSILQTILLYFIMSSFVILFAYFTDWLAEKIIEKYMELNK